MRAEIISLSIDIRYFTSHFNLNILRVRPNYLLKKKFQYTCECEY
jgi:hypothetical protein